MEPKPGMEMPMQDGPYTCQCPNCGQDMKLTLAKSEPAKMPMKSALPSMSEPAGGADDVGSMLEKATSGSY